MKVKVLAAELTGLLAGPPDSGEAVSTADSHRDASSPSLPPHVAENLVHHDLRHRVISRFGNRQDEMAALRNTYPWPRGSQQLASGWDS